MKYPPRAIDHRLQGFPTWLVQGFHIRRATHVLVTGRIRNAPKTWRLRQTCGGHLAKLGAKQIRVEATLRRVGKELLSTEPKTERSRRTMRAMVSLLKAQKVRQATRAAARR